jgi:hypothetical protein
MGRDVESHRLRRSRQWCESSGVGAVLWSWTNLCDGSRRTFWRPLRSVTTGVRQVPQPDRVRRRSVIPRFGLLARSQNLSEVIWSGGQIGDHETDLEQTATRKRCSRLTCADAQPSGGNEGSRLFHLLCGAFRRQATSVAPSNEGSRETGGQGVAGSNPVSPTPYAGTFQKWGVPVSRLGSVRGRLRGIGRAVPLLQAWFES